MKKILCLLFAVFMCLSAFSSCEKNVYERGEKINVLGTVFPPYDFARVVGGEYADAQMLMPPGTDSHDYSGDNPSDIMKIRNCDIFIYVGGETDSKWVEEVLSMLEKNGEHVPVAISLCDVCELEYEDSTGILEADEENHHFDDEYEKEADEHVWTSPKNAEMAVRAIAEAMADADPKHRDYYEKNCADYAKKLLELDNSFRELFNSASYSTLVFADRFPFRYFANEYNLKCYAAFNGCSSESEPSPTTIVKLCNIVSSEELPCVFYIETSKSGVPDAISKHTGVPAYLLHSCHTVTEKELKKGASYLNLMEQNLKTLKEAMDK